MNREIRRGFETKKDGRTTLLSCRWIGLPLVGGRADSPGGGRLFGPNTCEILGTCSTGAVLRRRSESAMSAL